MRAEPERAAPALVSTPAPASSPVSSQSRQCPARWAEPVQRPSAAGLVVAALIGAVAAGSWTLSTWLALDQPEAPGSVIAQASGPAAAESAPRAASPALD
jgi:hypothetical protein